MRILDCSGGKRNVWFNRCHPNAVYIDNRPEMTPNVLCDSTQLPFPNEVFDLIVFDPPHGVHGEHSYMSKYYGRYNSQEILNLLRGTSREAYRVSKPEALMLLKWNDRDQRLDHILKQLEAWEPLFGHKIAERSSHRASTYWLALLKRPLGYQTFDSFQKVLDFQGELFYQHK